MHDRHMRGALDQLGSPVERGITAADDHDPLSAKRFRVSHDVEDPSPVPRLRTSLRKAPRGKGSDAGGDDDRTRRETILVGDKNEMAIRLLQPRHTVPQVNGLREL